MIVERPVYVERPVEKDIRVQVPFVNVSVKKNVDSGFVACENCGGQREVQPQPRPSVVKKRQVCPSGQVSDRFITLVNNPCL